MFTEAKQAYCNPGYTFLEKTINFKLRLASLFFFANLLLYLFLKLVREFRERLCQFKRPRPGATGEYSGDVAPLITACASPNENCVP